MSPSSPFLRSLKSVKEELDQDNHEKSERLKSVFNDLSEKEDPFEVLNLISDQGVKEVYKVLDKRSNREVVLATLSDSKNKEKYQFSLVNDALVSSHLEHPNIPPIYEIGIKENKPFFTMKYLKGQSLEDIINQGHRKPFQNNEKYWINTLLHVCDALAFAHSKGILHLDIKADNIHINSYNEVLLFDWGCALNYSIEKADPSFSKVRSLLESSRKMGTIRGTPEYMSPEQASGNSESFSPATDIFMVGALMYHMISGKGLYNQQEMDQRIDAAEEGNFSPLKNLPKRLELILNHTLNISPEKRYSNIQDLSNDLQAYLDDEPLSLEVPTVWLRSRLYLKRHHRFTISSLFIFLIISIISTFSAIKLNESEKRTRKVKEELEVSYHKQENLLNRLSSITSLSDPNFMDIIFDDDGLYKIETLLDFQPENPSFWFDKGRVYLGKFLFKEAHFAFQKSLEFSENKIEHSFRAKRARELLSYITPIKDHHANLKGESDTLLKLILQIDDMKARCLMFKTIYQTYLPNDKEKILFFKKALTELNDNLQKVTLSFNNNEIEIDLSENQTLRETSPLYYFPVTKLNLENSSVKKLYSLYNPNLQSLNLASTQVSNLSFLPKFSLRHLNLSHNSITYFQLTRLSNLENISLIETIFLDYPITLFLSHLPNLKHIALGKQIGALLKQIKSSSLRSLKSVSISKDTKKISDIKDTLKHTSIKLILRDK